MKIQKIVANLIEENAYILSDGNEAAVFDPGGAENEILNLVSHLKLCFILLTHCHFDHTSAADFLRRKTGAPIYISKADSNGLLSAEGSAAARFYVNYTPFSADGVLEDRELFVGKNKIEVIPSPGHTKGSVCFKTGDILISGDTLFEGTIGNFERGDAQVMKKSVLHLMTLPDSTRVFPGHGNETTIGKERISNPYCSAQIWENI